MGFLQRLRQLNVQRCEEYFFPLNDWNVLEWAGAACGEAGETANVAKKLRRLETVKGTHKRILAKKNKKADLKKQLADEVGDTIVYLDLLCASEGIDMEEAVRNKFNKVSTEHGFEEILY